MIKSKTYSVVSQSFWQSRNYVKSQEDCCLPLANLYDLRTMYLVLNGLFGSVLAISACEPQAEEWTLIPGLWRTDRNNEKPADCYYPSSNFWPLEGLCIWHLPLICGEG